MKSVNRKEWIMARQSCGNTLAQCERPHLGSLNRGRDMFAPYRIQEIAGGSRKPVGRLKGVEMKAHLGKD